ncbi:MAG: putative lipid II flippase FtsW [Patescibacteria group bacterium]|nr:putative lipid II flippase FtsW [Patescibacteria group bacterium]
MKRFSTKHSSPDYLFITLLVILVIFGLVMLASASSDLAKTKFGDSYYYLKHQLLYGFVAGLVGFLIGSFIYYQHWQKLALPILILSLLLLILVFSPLGFHIRGGDRWLNVSGFTFQPSELLKLTFFIYLASWISKNGSRSKSFSQGFLPFLVLVGGVVILLLLQPSTSTAILIFAASILMYFTAGAKIRFLAIAALIAALGFTLTVYFSPSNYRLKRILTFINPSVDQLGRSYHINQALTAIGSGGLTGVGFGQSTTKLKFLPEPIGDSIFAVIGEEFGFIGSVSLIVIFLLFIWRGIIIAKSVADPFGRMLITGFISLIGLQAFVNIGAISGLIPLTGVPLPFVSYGGTALAAFLTMSGIIVNISKYR